MRTGDEQKVPHPSDAERAQTPVLLQVQGLSVRFPTARGEVQALDDVHFSLRRSQVLAVVGESGSGKSVLSRSIMRLLGRQARIGSEARIVFDGQDLLHLTEREMRDYRGKRLAMVFQDPMTALNPVRTIGSQLVEGLSKHLGLSAAQSSARALALLKQVGITLPEQRLHQYPHEMSGGMRQRVVIAMAIACEPELLIADEPTTALDVTVQAEIMELLMRLQQERQMTMILITHDLGLAAGFADEVAVMYAGQIVEQAQTRRLFAAPQMPYTDALLRSIPRLSDPPLQTLFSIVGRPTTTYAHTPPACRFAPRCSYRQARCDEPPPLTGEADRYRCWYPLEKQA